MKKTIILSFSLVLVGALVLTGCGEKVAEEAAENALENSLGGSVDVDIDNDTVTVNTSAGSWEAGEGASLPSGFPTDVHVIDGTITLGMTITENEAYSVSVETSKTVAQAKTEYETELAKDGWTINLTLDTGDISTIGAEKGNRTVAVSIMSEDGKTTVSIATATND